MAGLDSTTGPERPATVEDMIGWLEEDGCSRGIIGWKSEWTKEEVFGTPPSEPLVLGFKFGGGDQQGAEVPPQRDFDVNAAFRQQATAERREKHVKGMIQDHKNLIPAANREVDGRLLEAGLSPECLKTLDTGHASDVYRKLQKLSEITDPEPPPPRIQFQVMSDIRPGKLERVDIYLSRTCTLEEFEETMIDHRLVRFLRFKQQQAFIDLGGGGWESTTQFGANSRLEANRMASIGKQASREKMWMYQLVGEGEQSQDVDESAWKKIRDRSDFAWLMKILVNDSSKQVMVCHESSLETVKPPTLPEKDPSICEPGFDAADWWEEDWNEDVWSLIPEDFDFSKLSAGNIAGGEATGSASPELPCPPTGIGEVNAGESQSLSPSEPHLSPITSCSGGEEDP